jgi:hypothetical protein
MWLIKRSLALIWLTPVLVVGSPLEDLPAPGLSLRGVVFRSSDLSPVIDPVEIRVYDVVRDAAGFATRDPITARLRKGGLLLSTAARPADGSYNLSVPPIPGQDRRLVIVEFSRRNFAVTQVLDGVVIEKSQPSLISVVVS